MNLKLLKISLCIALIIPFSAEAGFLKKVVREAGRIGGQVAQVTETAADQAARATIIAAEQAARIAQKAAEDAEKTLKIALEDIRSAVNALVSTELADETIDPAAGETELDEGPSGSSSEDAILSVMGIKGDLKRQGTGRSVYLRRYHAEQLLKTHPEESYQELGRNLIEARVTEVLNSADGFMEVIEPAIKQAIAAEVEVGLIEDTLKLRIQELIQEFAEVKEIVLSQETFLRVMAYLYSDLKTMGIDMNQLMVNIKALGIVDEYHNEGFEVVESQ